MILWDIGAEGDLAWMKFQGISRISHNLWRFHVRSNGCCVLPHDIFYHKSRNFALQKVIAPDYERVKGGIKCDCHIRNLTSD